MKIIKSKGYIILIGIIVILIFLLYKQNYRYKYTVGGYDVLALCSLENEIEALVYTTDKNQLTQEKYHHHKEIIMNISQKISRSPNIRFMWDEIDRLIDSNDKNEFIEQNLENCRNVQQKLDSILKEYSNGIDVYNYFKDESNRKEFLQTFK